MIRKKAQMQELHMVHNQTFTLGPKKGTIRQDF